MKLNKIVLSTAIVAALSMATAVQAADGVVNFKGEILSKTCDVKIDGATSPATVNLPKVFASALTSAGETAGERTFEVQLSNCTGSVSLTKAAAIFEDNGGTVNAANGRLINTATVNPAANVELELLDATGGSIINAANKAAQRGATNKVPLQAAGQTVLPYTVRYHATGATTAGMVESSVAFTVEYE